MKLNEITKRDVKAFFLGVIFMLIFVIIYDGMEFKKGFHGVKDNASVESIK